MVFNSIKNNKVASNTIWIISGRIAQAVIGLVVNMFTARYLGPSNYGLISYAASIVAFVVPLMNLGLSNILVQEVTNNPDDEGKIFGSSIIISVVSAIACIIGVTTYTLFVDKGERTTNIVVILYSLILLFQAVELIQYWFQAKLLSKYMSIISFVAYLVVACYKVTLLIIGANVFFFAITSAFDVMLIAISLVFAYGKLGGRRLSFSGRKLKEMLNVSKHYIASALMITIFAQTDKIMIKIMIDETAVGYYSAAVNCASLTAFVFAAIIDSMRPAIYARKKNNDIKGYELNISRTYCIVTYLALAQSLVMTLLSKYVIGILYGLDYYPAIIVLRIIVWYTTFSYLGAIRDIWILGEGKQRFLWVLNLGGAIANIVLNFVLIPSFGINGAAIASLITQIFTNIFMNIIVWPLKHNNTLIFRGLNPMLVLNYLFSRNNKE